MELLRARLSAHPQPLFARFPRCSSDRATPAHPFPAIFGNFHPFTWPNNTRARAASIGIVQTFEREIAFPRGKISRQATGKIVNYISTNKATRKRIK